MSPGKRGLLADTVHPHRDSHNWVRSEGEGRVGTLTEVRIKRGWGSVRKPGKQGGRKEEKRKGEQKEERRKRKQKKK